MAEEYELGTVGPIPTVNPNVAKIGEMLKYAKKYADQYYVKENIPLIGGMTLGEFLLGQAPEEVERLGQGDYPFRNPATVVGTGGNRLDVFKTGRFEPTFDVLANVALPLVGTAQMAAKPLARTLGPKAAEMAEDYLTKQGAILNIVEPSPVKSSIKDVSTTAKPYSVSTRVPTAVKAEEDALKESLLSNYKAFRSDQKAFEHNINIIKEYPNLSLKSKNADINAEKFVEHVKDNLLYLHDQVPADTRARSKLWYEGANKIANNISKEYGISEPAASGILAVLSPQKDWFMNVSLGERVASTLAHKQGFKWDSAMSDVANDIYGKPQYKPLLDAIKGKRLEELKDPVEKAIWIRTYDQANNPREHFVVTPEGDFSGIRTNAGGEPTKTGWGSNAEIAKAVDIFENPTRENISQRLGGQHKVRNFYMNIYDPHNSEGHTTIDTHAVAAGLLRPLSGNTREVSHNFGSNYPGEIGPKNSAFTGKQGTYGLYHEGYQRAAREREALPREMQSITWEAVRGLFPDTFKNAKNSQEIEDIWKTHKSNKISVDEARKQIFEKAGGINEPEWKQ